MTSQADIKDAARNVAVGQAERLLQGGGWAHGLAAALFHRRADFRGNKILVFDDQDFQTAQAFVPRQPGPRGLAL
jgi:hypothetical protein